MNKLTSMILATAVFLMSVLSSAGTASASPTGLTAAIQTSLELTAATADTSARSRLKEQYSELSALSAQYDSREQQIRSLHDSNTQALIVVRTRIREIDESTITLLTQSVASAKQRSQPLFDQYSALNRRISLLKGLKDKTLNMVLRAQSDSMKIVVQLARQEIRDQEARLKTAKDNRSKKIAAARKTLAGIESPQEMIKSQKSVAASLNKRISADFSDFKSAIRKQNPALASQALSSLISGYRQVAACKQKIIEYEQRIAAVIANTTKQVAA